jgi:hypothetical protein
MAKVIEMKGGWKSAADFNLADQPAKIRIPVGSLRAPLVAPCAPIVTIIPKSWPATRVLSVPKSASRSVRYPRRRTPAYRIEVVEYSVYAAGARAFDPHVRRRANQSMLHNNSL